MGYDYGFEYAFPEMMEGAAEGIFAGAIGITVAIVLLVYLVMLAFGVVSYVLNAVGMYRIAKRRGIHHAWLAWIPVGNTWLLGSISDHYQYVAKQKKTSRRKILLILSIICVACAVVYFVGALMLSAETAILSSMADEIILIVAWIIIGLVGVMGVSIAIAVFCYIAYFDLFRSCKPQNDVLFLVLSIIFKVTLAFFVFACSGSDEGMPARRVPEAVPQIPYQPEKTSEEEQEIPAEEAPVEEIPVVETEIVEDAE